MRTLNRGISFARRGLAEILDDAFRAANVQLQRSQTLDIGGATYAESSKLSFGSASFVPPTAVERITSALNVGAIIACGVRRIS